MPESRVHSNPFPRVDWSKVKERGNAETNAAQKQHDLDMEKINKLNDSKLK
jgi:hypothetical protein